MNTLDEMYMMTKSVLIVILSVICVKTTSAQQNSQKKVVFTKYPPAFTLQFAVNYDKSVPELSGANDGNERSEDIRQGKTFGGNGGFGGSIVSKIRLDKKGMFRFDQSIAYNRILSFPYNDIKSVNDVGSAEYNVFSGALGMEYSFIPSRNLRAYLGAELNASIINGDLRIWLQRIGHPISDTNESYSVSNSFRMGYGINAGTEYVLSEKIGLNLGIKYSCLNAFFKNAEGSNADTEFSLRDDDNPSLNFAGNKNFSFFTISAGVNLYFGVKSKE